MTSYLHRDHALIRAWLILCMGLVAAMVFVGGYTRLSGSGLSITEWKPIHGIIPPMNEAAWQEEFAAYQASPQYQKVNLGMTLAEFKIIFWPEYWHRVLGRMIGVLFFAPLLFFAARRSITRRFGLRLLGIFVLGGLQGLAGWLMVKSGLVDAPLVSHFRLALHLAMAFTIFALLLWAWLDLRRPTPQLTPVKASVWAWYRVWFVLLCVQIVYGAFVAGTHAGLMYNTWPTMNGAWIPSEIGTSANIASGMLFTNLTMIQLIHRTMAVVLVLSFTLWWYLHRRYVKNIGLGKDAARVALLLALQFVLGVFTLLHQVPMPLAMAHQMVALALFSAAVMLMYKITRTDH